MSKIDRRGLMARASATAAAWPFLWLPHNRALANTTKFRDYPFTLGVASGDPSADGFVIWTRLAPEPLAGGGMPTEDVQVKWRVAEDEGMKRVVREGTATAAYDWGHSVHVELSGLLPDRTYWYQFDVGSESSPLGRSRTTPAGHALMDEMRFAFASCQHYEHGYYTAYRHMAQEDLHAVFHLGDYIYEGRPSTKHVRKHNSPEIQSLTDYRNRYALYKSDLDLQAAHAAFPWIVTWDDHEFDNNYAGDISEQPDVQAEKFLQRRAAAYQAYYEHMPLRRSALPHGPDMLLYRSVNYGQLAQFSVLDTRQYRSDQPCGDKLKPPCAAMNNSSATMLGTVQEKWLQDGMAASPATWNVLAQQVMMGHVDRVPGVLDGLNMDQWPGYTAARERLFRFWKAAEVANPIVLTGDIHSNWVNDLKVDFESNQGPIVGTEFVGTSISSGGNGSQNKAYAENIRDENPFVKFFNAERGYVRCRLTDEHWQSDYRVVSSVTDQEADVETRASFVVANGQPGAQRAS